MTLIQMQPRPANAHPVHQTVEDAMEAACPQVCDDMTVEVALAVMASARTEHLLVCDEDGLCTGLVSRAGLATVRDSAAYTDQVRLRDLPGDRGPVAVPTHVLSPRQQASAMLGIPVTV
ncbi:CBS domain-containing protein [Streptomyces yangpuensis]|uniref:CBS domain-containing protein n=1 Tax=Streptomyces yangpuensis TaxID=1648182 RepID=UPI00365D0D10